MKLLRSCKLNILQWGINPKYAFVAMYMVLYMWYETQGFVAYSRALGYPVRPWLFPLLPCDPGNFVPIFLAFVLLVSDAPFRNRQQQFVLLRVGKGAWIGGQLMYILFTSVVFTAALWLLSWIFLLPNLAWGNDWGPVLTTTAVAGGQWDYNAPLILSYGCMTSATPLEATLWVAGVMIAVCFLLGEIMVVCNLWARKGAGAVVVSGFSILPLVISVFAYAPRLTKRLLWISPVSWLDRSLMGNSHQNLPSYTYGALMPIGLGIALGLLIIGTIHRCNLDTQGE